MNSSNTDKPCNLVVLISGSGSNLQSFIDYIAAGDLKANIAAVFSNRPGVQGLQRAAAAGIKTETIDHTLFESREAFDQTMINNIDQYQPDLIILAGFMRILTPSFVKHYSGRLLNIHPSLLPNYPGLNTHQRAIDAGDKKAGATVHFVTEQLDGGPPVLQASTDIEKNDNPEKLAERIIPLEHKIFPLAAKWFSEGRLKLEGNYAKLDSQIIPPTGILFKD